MNRGPITVVAMFLVLGFLGWMFLQYDSKVPTKQDRDASADADKKAFSDQATAFANIYQSVPETLEPIQSLNGKLILLDTSGNVLPIHFALPDHRRAERPLEADLLVFIEYRTPEADPAVEVADGEEPSPAASKKSMPSAVLRCYSLEQQKWLGQFTHMMMPNGGTLEQDTFARILKL